jgi:hypothetical protein
MEPPQEPAGPFVPEEAPDGTRRGQLIEEIEATPRLVRAAIAGLSDRQLDTRYKNWTVRQIVHHLADSHVNSYVRFKLALTEDRPTIKPYQEGLWADLADARTGAIEPPLALLDGIHRRWVQLLLTMTEEQFGRSFYHPESGQTVVLSSALGYYAWHGRHHTAQILWVRSRHGWG